MALERSKYFAPSEMACKDEHRTPYPDDWDIRLSVLFATLDIIREAYGGPLYVVSGYRTEAYNKHVGGAKNSQHVEGRAADIRPVKGELFASVARLRKVIYDLIGAGKLPAIGGVGYYAGRWLHVDTRPRAGTHIAQWDGSKVGDEKTA